MRTHFPVSSGTEGRVSAGPRMLWRGLRVAGAAGLTALVFALLVAARIYDSGRVPDREIRRLDTIEEVALPAPPPPPSIDPEDPPPPPPPPTLPRLEIQLENVAPPVAATLDRRVDLTMVTADFSLEVDPDPIPRPIPPKPTPRPVSPKPKAAPPKAAPRPVMKQSYSAGELDARPRLINRPSAAYPAALQRKGIKEGRVVLEVTISPSGSVSVRRVISSSHPDFASMARTFASRARFTAPKKNGQPVTAIYQWPLILKP
ncbi:MAG: energy transducer TonB [Verrucomicrobiae bacterium]|nr:energy transducer TonB [Verrucomicrobiae bacterium]